MISQQLLDRLQRSQPPVPARALEIAKQILDAEFDKAFEGPASLTDELIPIYANHFSRDDVQGLLAFYSSDLGKKTVASIPAIVQEGAIAGQRWAEKQMPRILGVLEERLRAEGFIP